MIRSFHLLLLSTLLFMLVSGVAWSQSATQSIKRVFEAEPGPWGDLEYYHIYLDAPPHLAALLPLPSQTTEWRFPDFVPGQVEKTLISMGVAEEKVRALYDDKRILQTDDGFIVYPTIEFLMTLDAQTRTRVYTLLANFEENPFHKHPVVIQEKNLREWFRGTGLNDQFLLMISKLVYYRGRSALFSDVSALLSLVQSAQEERQLIQALTRTRSLVLRLKVSKDMDLESISSYWSAGYKYKDIMPVLQTVARSRAEQRLDVVHLIPPTARRYLYSYPSYEDGLRGRFPDSFWAAINFFRFNATDVYGDSLDVEEVIHEEYRPISGPYQYGDLILLVREADRRAFHACVYLADGIVFTKNSPDVYIPWTLMTMEDLINYHERGEPCFISAWRPNEFVEESSSLEFAPPSFN